MFNCKLGPRPATANGEVYTIYKVTAFEYRYVMNQLIYDVNSPDVWFLPTNQNNNFSSHSQFISTTTIIGLSKHVILTIDSDNFELPSYSIFSYSVDGVRRRKDLGWQKRRSKPKHHCWQRQPQLPSTSRHNTTLSEVPTPNMKM